MAWGLLLKMEIMPYFDLNKIYLCMGHCWKKWRTKWWLVCTPLNLWMPLPKSKLSFILQISMLLVKKNSLKNANILLKMFLLNFFLLSIHSKFWSKMPTFAFNFYFIFFGHGEPWKWVHNSQNFTITFTKPPYLQKHFTWFHKKICVFKRVGSLHNSARVS